MNARIGKFIAVSLGALLAVGFGWSQRTHPPAPAEFSGATPVTVETGMADWRTLDTRVELIGSLQSENRVTIAARLTAEVRNVAVETGDRVRKGDLLVELDAADLTAHVSEARAHLVEAEENLAEAERELERARVLFEREARSLQEFDRAKTRYSSAGAQREAAVEGLAAAQTRLGFTRLVAPFDGIVSQRTVDPGDLASPGRALLELHTPESLQLVVTPEEGLLIRFALGQSLPLQLDSLTDTEGTPRVMAGTVVEIAPVIDARTSSGLVKIQIPYEEAILPGMLGRTWLSLDRVEALVLPAEAVVRRGQLELVFSIPEATRRVRMHVVRTGRSTGDGHLEILAGIDEPLRVVTHGASRLRDGTTVQIPDTQPESQRR